jgi:hypothetical protein
MGSVAIRGGSDLCLGLKPIGNRIEAHILKGRRVSPGWRRRFRLSPTTPSLQDPGIVALYDNSPLEDDDVEAAMNGTVEDQLEAKVRAQMATHPKWCRSSVARAADCRRYQEAKTIADRLFDERERTVSRTVSDTVSETVSETVSIATR